MKILSLLRCFALTVPATAGFAQAPTTTPSTPLPAGDGWRAERIHHSDGGVWYAHIDKVVEAHGANDVLAGDDKGRLLLLTVYSGQWTAHSVVGDGQWLAPTRPADVDPRVPGREIYAGGRSGTVHRAVLLPQAFARFQLEASEIGHAAGEEFHAVVAADLIPGGSAELLAFGISGAVFQLTADATGDSFTMRNVATLPGRVREVAIVPGHDGGAPTMYGASRSGHLLRMQLHADGLQHQVVLREDCGLGRIALAKGRPGVLYTTRDDGVVVRVQLGADGTAQREVAFAGGQGLRGIASGRFFGDDREAFACYGYDQIVHLVERTASGWRAATLFTSPQRGHCLTVGELDGRNGTDELVAAGFDGDVVLLSRPPGYALPGAAVPASEAGAPAPAAPPATKVLRVAARFSERGTDPLSPLRYQGGFESKTLLFETLVRFAADGRLAPGLASAWRRDDGGRTFVFTLRDGATWHDGSPVRAADVAVHFRRWVGLPEHGWLRSAAHITAVRASGERELRIELDQPTALLADLAVVNPCALLAPASWSREGEFGQPLGSGPFRCEGLRDGVLRYRQHGGEARVDLVRPAGDALDALLRGDVDAVVGSWLMPIDAGRAQALRRDARFQVAEAPGSLVWHLQLRSDRGPLTDLHRRRAVAAAIDRGELVRVALHGAGEPTSGWVAPSIVDWPAGRLAAPTGAVAFAAPLRLASGDADELLVATLVGQLQRAGIAVERIPGGNAGDWDLKLQRTLGLPYDPFAIADRHGRRLGTANAMDAHDAPRDEALAAAIDGLLGAADEATWPQHYARIQARLDELAAVVPLCTPKRFAVARAGLPVPRFPADPYSLDAAWLAAAATAAR